MSQDQITVAESMDTQNPATIFASVLKECAQHPPALGVWCWLLPLSRQLGLTDEKAIELAEAYPHLHEELSKQLPENVYLAYDNLKIQSI